MVWFFHLSGVCFVDFFVCFCLEGREKEHKMLDGEVGRVWEKVGEGKEYDETILYET